MCCVQSLYSCVPLISWLPRTVYTRPVVKLARSSTNSVVIFQSRSLALQPHRSLLNPAVQQKEGLGLTWTFLIRTVSYTSHKPMYKVNDDGFIKPFEAQPMGSLGRSKRSRVDLESTLYFVSSPPSQKSSTNQKLAPMSCAGNISSIRVHAHGS